ncbi:MAG: hypothetical protein AAGC55_34250, partial [Myxococcota bacterium]
AQHPDVTQCASLDQPDARPPVTAVELSDLADESDDEAASPTAEAAALAALPTHELGAAIEIAAPMWIDRNRVVVVRGGCTEDHGCAGEAVLLTRRTGSFAVAAQMPLPGAEQAFAPYLGLDIDRIAVADLIGDDRPELWLTYIVGGKPEPAVGASSAIMVAIYDISDLRPIWSGSVGSSAEGDMAHACRFQLYAGDLSCDGLDDLLIAQHCDRSMCLDDEPIPAVASDLRATDDEESVADGCATQAAGFRRTLLIWDRTRRTLRAHSPQRSARGF